MPLPIVTVSVRIGWCQPGANRPETISASGTPGTDGGGEEDARARRDLRWFRSMWLSNRDLLRLFLGAIRADSSGWPGKAILVNGMSANQGMPWDIKTAERLIAYRPKDDLFRSVPEGLAA